MGKRKSEWSTLLADNASRRPWMAVARLSQFDYRHASQLNRADVLTDKTDVTCVTLRSKTSPADLSRW
jgi:hypothetical protein